MLRRSNVNRIVPFHPFVVGGRPAERGFLYRDSQQNAYSRLQAVKDCQRTEEEARMKNWLHLPEVWTILYITGIGCSLVFIKWGSGMTLEWNAHKNRHVTGGMNWQEVWQRNQQMAEVFEYHREMIDATRKEFGPRPAIFDPPTKGNVDWNDTYGKPERVRPADIMKVVNEKKAKAAAAAAEAAAAQAAAETAAAMEAKAHHHGHGHGGHGGGGHH